MSRTLGQVAYEAHQKAYGVEPGTPWANLPSRNQNAFEAAADAVASVVDTPASPDEFGSEGSPDPLPESVDQ